MPIEQMERYALQSARNGRDLLEHVDAVAIALEYVKKVLTRGFITNS
ncbi:MAG TPA: hypothetical protein PLG60_06650 [Acidimicrobiales bacterium]|nr:hypothetical protein [Acidimicrobiales bacterium]